MESDREKWTRRYDGAEYRMGLRPSRFLDDYLLAPGELPRLFAPYAGSVLKYQEWGDAPTPTAKILFRKG